MELINKRQKMMIINNYYFRLLAKNIKVDKKEFDDQLLLLNNDEIISLFSDILKGKTSTITSSLKDLKISATAETPTIVETKVAPVSSLDDITRFKKGNTNYFKFADNNGNMTIVKCKDGNPKTLFKNILNNKNNLPAFFESIPNEQGMVVDLTKSSNIDESKHPKVQVAIVREIEKRTPNKQLITAMKENLYVIDNDNEDIVLSIDKENGKYQVKPLAQKRYNKKPEHEINNAGSEENSHTNSLGKQYVLSTNPARHSNEERAA